MKNRVQAHLMASGGWHLPRTAEGLHARGALAGLWISDNFPKTLPLEVAHRCWPFHLAMKPFYHLASQIVVEKNFYRFFPIWKRWIEAQDLTKGNVIHAIMGYATEPFNVADATGALKVIDAPNSHPTSYYGFWQRECDLWCPGEKVPIPQWMFARMNREIQRADMILCPSFFVRDSMILNGVPEEKCVINPFGVDTSIFKARKSIPDRPRFIVVGTICVRKGFQYLFRAFEKVKKAFPDAELICVGGAKRDFRKEWPRWKGTFTHYEHLAHSELSALMETCSAFVFPSCEEGFARVIPEAMASGLPIIATYESGATTLVEDGKEGFIVPHDFEKIAEAMIRLAGETLLNEEMGRNARIRGAEKNTWQDYSDRLLAEYETRLAMKQLSLSHA